MSSLDWTLLESSYVIKNNWISLRADKFRLPSGRIVAPCYVFEYRPWVNVVAMTQKQVVLIRQFRHGLQKTTLELPGGTTDPEDASPLAAIQRELSEETGYASDSWFRLGQLSPNPATHNNLVYSFLATGVEQTSQPMIDEVEQLETVFMPLEQVVDLAVRGGLMQAMHVSALFLALARLGRVR